MIHNNRNTRGYLAIQQFPGYGNQNSTITLAMIRMHTSGFSYVVRPNNTTRHQASAAAEFYDRSEQNDILSAYNICFFADPAMNNFFHNVCLIQT